MSEFLPPEQRDTRYYLWNEKYTCRVPYLQTLSVDYIREFGLPTSGDPVIDAQMANELIMRRLSINDMVEFFKKGVTVRLVTPTDSKIIYERIAAHLEAWRVKIDNELNIRNAPLDDLVELDKFASAVYVHARNHFTKGYADSVLARQMSSVLRVSRSGILKPLENTVRVINAAGAEEEEVVKKPEHNSMAELFLGRKARLQGGSRWTRDAVDPKKK